MPTASCFDKILTPKTLKPSASSFGYKCEKLAEWLGPDGTSSQVMERGTNKEPQARNWYAWEYNVDVREVGFITNDAGTAGCSPDGLIGDDGGLEAKAPLAKTHAGYVLRPSALVDAYRLQVQGALWVCERKWWDIISWHPSMPKVVQRVERDEPLIEKLAVAVEAFAVELDAALVQFGYKEPAKMTA